MLNSGFAATAAFPIDFQAHGWEPPENHPRDLGLREFEVFSFEDQWSPESVNFPPLIPNEPAVGFELSILKAIEIYHPPRKGGKPILVKAVKERYSETRLDRLGGVGHHDSNKTSSHTSHFSDRSKSSLTAYSDFL